ncbi:dehydroascorbate reductase [Olea europaea subsp. europaea]|uniref:glutathione transferase n=1 Tax=Olea europaea subsp. europaea TaxID=158383 RepID=A0A8S0U2D9_OLEEU|nr:dehydroascorbate reductase [Olea europaea subsp. europaea]
MSSNPSDPLEVCSKASLTKPNALGDCPFTQRILLTLDLPFALKLVNFTNEPEWFLKVSPEGKVPLIKLDEKSSLNPHWQNPLKRLQCWRTMLVVPELESY